MDDGKFILPDINLVALELKFKVILVQRNVRLYSAVC